MEQKQTTPTPERKPTKRKTPAKKRKPVKKPKPKPTREELIAQKNEELLKRKEKNDQKKEQQKEKAKEKRKDKAEDIAWVDLDDKQALKDSAYFWMTNYEEVDHIISEDIDAFKLTPTERVALLKVQAVLMKQNGRPSKMTQIVKNKLIEYFEQDCTIKEACRRAKIAEKTYYRWKEQDQAFCHEMEYYENYAVNISRWQIMKSIRWWSTSTALEIAQKRDERYKPQREEAPQNITLIQINNPRPVEELTTTPRLMIDVHEPEDVRQRRAEKFGRTE